MSVRLRRFVSNPSARMGVQLTREGERELFKGHEPVSEKRKNKLKEELTDREAFIADTLVKANTGLVHREAIKIVETCRKYHRLYGHVDIEDFVQEGHMGQISAMERFDIGKGCRFTTYSMRSVKSFMVGFACKGQARTKVYDKDLTRVIQINSFVNGFEEKNRRKPTLGEIAKGTNMKEGKVKELLRVWRGMETTTVVRDGETFDRLARTPDRKAGTPEKKTQVREMKELIKGLLCELPPLERNIIERRFGFNGYEEEGLKKISDSYGLSRERVRQLKERGLKRIRERIGEQFDASVLEAYE